MKDEKNEDVEEALIEPSSEAHDSRAQDANASSEATESGDEVEADSEEAEVEGEAAKAPSIFDSFEPPPEVDPNHLGPIPIVPDPQDIDGVGTETAEVATSIPPLFALPDDELDEGDASSGTSDEGPTEAEAEDPQEADDAPDSDEVDDGDNDENTDETQAGSLLHDFFGDEAEEEDSRPKAVSTPIVGDAEAPADLPHWTEPATGQVPRVVVADQDGEVWSDLSGPRWHGEGPEWAGDDLADVFGFTPAEESSELIDDVKVDHDDLPNAGAPQRSPIPRQRPTAQPAKTSGGRNVPQAIMVGALVAALALAAFYFGKATTVALITLIAVLGGLELFNKMREVGVHPATLLGTVAAGAMPLATYHRGPAGFMAVASLLVVFGALWYIVGADSHRPALNMGLTMLGVMWVGGLASFAALIIRLPDGISILLVAVVVTVVFDTGAYAGGRMLGKTPFHSASPNKTWEGTLIGVVASIAAAEVLGLWNISAFSENLWHFLLVGLLAGILAPLGDLTESIIKRDLGVKDMGTLLPGHGGILDRVDGLLFVLPGVYYLALLLL